MSGSGQGHLDLTADKARALTLCPVSRETERCLDRFVATFLVWQTRLNLVSASTVAQLWTRHIADSLQLVSLAPDAKLWIDLGSGGGFPGIPIACTLVEVPGATVHLIESNSKKAAFLREAVRAAAVPAQVHQQRVEAFGKNCAEAVQVVTAFDGLAVMEVPISAAGTYVVETINLGLGPVQVWSAATPTVVRE